MFKFDDGSGAPREREERARRIAREVEAFRALRAAADRERDEMLDIVAEAILREFDTMSPEPSASRANEQERASPPKPRILMAWPHGLRLVR